MSSVCSRCNGTGIVMAYGRMEENPYIFAFKDDCHFGETKNVKYPRFPGMDRYIPISEDKFLEHEWVYEQTELKQTDTAEFRYRLQLWGKERFRYSYNKVKKQKEVFDGSHADAVREATKI